MRVTQSLSFKNQLALTPTLKQAISLLAFSHEQLADYIMTESADNPLVSIQGPRISQPFLENTYEIPETSEHSMAAYLEQNLWESSLSLQIKNTLAKVIEDIDDNGFVNADFLQRLSKKEQAAYESWVKQLEPLGLGARDIYECVIWQLEKQPPTIAQQKLIDFFQAVRKDKEFLYYKIDFFNTLEKQYPGIEQQAQRLFQQLELSPAAAFQSLPDVSIVAELLLKKNNGQFYVCLNEEALYDIDITLPEKKDQQHFYQSAQSLKKMVATRYKTLLDVARFLVQAQQEFFTAGPKALKPLQLSDIATALALHESTISRIVQSKYLWAETHFIPLKSLLSRKLKHQDLGAVSTVHVRDCLEKLLRYENPREPLSDQQLQYILSHQGYDLARRTIAKHREILGFKNSRHRKISY